MPSCYPCFFHFLLHGQAIGILSLITKLQNLNSKFLSSLYAISDPYVKLCLKSPDRRVEKRKTKTVKCTLNPIFNEAFNFNVANANMEESSLEIVVMDFDNIGRDELIGRILLAGNAISLCYG